MIELNQWQNYLQQIITVNNFDTSHPYLYSVTSKNNQTRKYELLEKNQYKQFCKDHPHSSCRKLSLSEIYAISRQFLDRQSQGQFMGITYQIPIVLKFESAIENFIGGIELASTQVVSETQAFIEGLNASISADFTISKALKKMADRSTQKHQQEKIKGIWGKIKYYIWSWFFDLQKRINKLDQEVQTLEGNIIQTKIIDSIKTRIYINMDGFKDQVQLSNWKSPPQIRIIEEENMDRPKVIKLWLTKYHPDKYKLPEALSEENQNAAKQHIQKIIILMKIWEEVLKSENSFISPKKPTQVNSSLLLEQ